MLNGKAELSSPSSPRPSQPTASSTLRRFNIDLCKPEDVAVDGALPPVKVTVEPRRLPTALAAAAAAEAAPATAPSSLPAAAAAAAARAASAFTRETSNCSRKRARAGAPNDSSVPWASAFTAAARRFSTWRRSPTPRWRARSRRSSAAAAPRSRDAASAASADESKGCWPVPEATRAADLADADATAFADSRDKRFGARPLALQSRRPSR